MRKTTVLSTIATGLAAVIVGCAPMGSRVAITADNNPTTLAGRGQPSIDDERRPCAWVYIDGHEGHFIEKNGVPQVQWIIDEPVGPSPTFRVEAIEETLGLPKDFKCVLYPYESTGDSGVGYGIASEDGAFKTGTDYSLLNPGPEFILRIAGSDELLSELDPLAPGAYLLAAKVENREMDAATLAVTYFTVSEAAPAGD